MDVRYASRLENEAKSGECEIKKNLRKMTIEDLLKLTIEVAQKYERAGRYYEKIPYPLHIGITEAGIPRTGINRSAVGISTLLYLGIGDTIRVSLTAHPREEVIAGYEILKSLNG